jgi:hypothetical protein
MVDKQVDRNKKKNLTETYRLGFAEAVMFKDVREVWYHVSLCKLYVLNDL